MHVCPHCGNPLLTQTKTNQAGSAIVRDVCPIADANYATGWTTPGHPSAGVFTLSTSGRDFDATTTTAAAAPAPTGEQTLLTTVGTAGRDLSALRAVTVGADSLVDYPNVQAALAGPLWLTLTAVKAGEQVTLASVGQVDEQAWRWTPGRPVFLAADGYLTQTPYLFGAHVRVGSAVSPTRLQMLPLTPIELVA